MNELIELIKKARFVWVCGNGGSAATAEHFTTDLFKKGIKAVCLNSNVSVMTMIANDYGYEQVFSKQLEVLANSDDFLITISCSGTSSNIIRALNLQERIGFGSFQFETFSTDRDYGLLENKHLMFAHEVARQL